MFFLSPSSDCAWCGVSFDHGIHERDRLVVSHPYQMPDYELMYRRRHLPPGRHHPDYVVHGSPYASVSCGFADVLVVSGAGTYACCPVAGAHEDGRVSWKTFFNVDWEEPLLAGWAGTCGCKLFVSAWALRVTPASGRDYASFIRVERDPRFRGWPTHVAS